MSNFEEIGGEFDLSKDATTTNATPVSTQNPNIPPIAQFNTPVSVAAPSLPHKIEMKPKIPIEEIPEELRGKPLTTKNLEELAELLADKFDRSKNAQIVSKSRVPITDFSKIKESDIYDPDVFIEAKPFMSSDSLKITLRDQNYESRWVNKNSQRLGYMLSIGFSYIEAKDLESQTDAMVYLDSSGHYTINDVVAMKIQKSIYFPALKAAAIRAQNVVSAANASAKGAEQAGRYMLGAKDDDGSSVGGEFTEAQRAGTLKFYDPNAVLRS